jgi:hypothetical protein
MSDLLYITACIAFFAIMIAFVFLYDRSVGSRIYKAPDASGEANGRDEHVARPV